MGTNLTMTLLSFAGWPLILWIYRFPQETMDMVWEIMFWHGTLQTLVWPLAFTLPVTFRSAGDARFAMGGGGAEHDAGPGGRCVPPVRAAPVRHVRGLDRHVPGLGRPGRDLRAPVPEGDLSETQTDLKKGMLWISKLCCIKKIWTGRIWSPCWADGSEDRKACTMPPTR